MRSKSLVPIVASLAATAACASGASGGPGHGPRVIAVPGDARTIAEAVAAAEEGDLVLVAPGVYRESVAVTAAGVTVRGTDRDSVVIDGEFRRANGIVVTAPRVAVENLTVRNSTQNGVLVTGVTDASGHDGGYTTLDPARFPPLQGFRVSHVTAHNNGLYGIYAFDAQHGVIEHSYASGSADSGIYVGQCKPCHITVRANVAERNAVGFEGGNASHDLVVTENRFSGNRVGVVSLTDYREAFVPQEDAAFVGNIVSDNAEPRSPAHAEGGWGVGVVISGGSGNLVRANRITGNPVAGVVIASADDIAPRGNRTIGNLLTGTGVVYAASGRARGQGNCLADNEGDFRTAPADLARVAPCPAGHGVDLAGARAPEAQAPPGLSFRKVPAPPPQPDLPGPVDGLPGPWTAPARPTVDDVLVPGPDLLADQAGADS